MTIDKIVGKTELFAYDAHFVFKESAQRFDKSGKGQIFWETADVVVALDVCRVVCARFDDVGINCALGKEIIAFLRFRYFGKRLDKLLADNLSLAFGIGYARDFGKELFACVNDFELERHIGKRFFDLFCFVLAHEAVIDVHAKQLIGDSLAYECGNDGAVNAARKAEENFFVAHFFAYELDLRVDIVVQRIVAFCSAHL